MNQARVAKVAGSLPSAAVFCLAVGLGGWGCARPAAPARAATEAAPKVSVVVVMTGAGFTIDGTSAVSTSAVAEEVGRRNAEAPVAVRIDAAPGTNLSELAELMDRLRSQGVYDISLVAVPVLPAAGEAAAAGAAPEAQAAKKPPIKLPPKSPADSPEPPAKKPPIKLPDRTPDTAAGSPPPPPDAESLPEVVVKNIGLHIGGGTNTDAEKAPFRAAIEKQFGALRTCYKQVEDPLKGGVFGVDLRVGRAGGKPEVSQPRTSMKGPAFRDCVIDAFKAVEFDKPAKGPTVLSYSVRFTAGAK